MRNECPPLSLREGTWWWSLYQTVAVCGMMLTSGPSSSSSSLSGDVEITRQQNHTFDIAQ